MPIPSDQLNRAFVLIPPDARVIDVPHEVPFEKRRILWIVTPISGTDFAVFRIADLIAYLKESVGPEYMRNEVMGQPLRELAGFLAHLTRPAVDISANWNTVKKSWDALSDPPLAVLENGALVAVLKAARRGGGDSDSIYDTPKSANGGGQSSSPPKNGGDHLDEPSGMGSGDEESVPSFPSDMAPPLPFLPEEPEIFPPPAPPPPPIDLPIAPPAPRFLSARFIDHAKDAPLQVNTTYKLGISVQVTKRLTDIVAAPLAESADWFPVGVARVTLTVQLISDDFEIFSDPQKLFVPRSGSSLNEPTFDVSPKHDGPAEIVVLVLKESNAIQSMTLHFNVGAAGGAADANPKVVGRNLSVIGDLKPRDLNLLILYKGSEFEMFLSGSAAWRAVLPVSKEALAVEIENARQVLEHLVSYDAGANDFVFQRADTKIPRDVYEETLPRVAEAGWNLFRNIFFPPGADEGAKSLGRLVRKLAQNEPRLKIQVVSREMMLPWSILYMADNFDPTNINPELFLGSKHIIEHLPMEANMDFGGTIAGQPALNIGLNLNPDIDAQFKINVIAEQEQYFASLAQNPAVKILRRKTGDEIINAWAKTDTPDQIAYFYCHANSVPLAQGGANENRLEFGNGRWIYTLRDFNLRANTDTRVPNAPLIFLNACQSAQLSPLFYNGFMPYFVSKGARGLIGTECTVPANFAAEFAERFFDEFLKGKSVGDVLLALRREYLFDRNNILGFLYALYCDGDTFISPPLV